MTIFAKGNLDVRDSLHSLWLGGELRWNGINGLLRERDSKNTIRVRHETSTGTSAILNAGGQIPPALADRALPLAPYSLETQFGQLIFKIEADAYVLSIQPDLQFAVARHRREGYLFHPYQLKQWPDEERDWFRREFEPTELLEPAASMANFEALIARLQARSDAPILIYNMSSFVPGETVHSHAGMEDIFSTRIKRFNLALVELSQRTGVSIVDVDRIVAEQGARVMKLDTIHLTEQGCRAVAEQVLGILEDCGCLPPEDAGA